VAIFSSGISQQKKCELCERITSHHTVHHLIPRSRDKNTQKVAILCKACHGMVHRLISNTDLEKQYYTVDLLKKHSEVRQFISWVRKQDPHKRVKIK
jgi:hypothetical protein